MLLLVVVVAVVVTCVPSALCPFAFAGAAGSVDAICCAHSAAYTRVLECAVHHAHRPAERHHLPQLHWLRAEKPQPQGHLIILQGLDGVGVHRTASGIISPCSWPYTLCLPSAVAPAC